MRHRIFALLLLALLASGCEKIFQTDPLSPREITPTPQPVISTVTPLPPTPTATPLPGVAQQQTPSKRPGGVFLAVFLPLLVLGVAWGLLETYLSQYLRPRSIDLTEMQVKTGDGLFMNPVVSVTARKTLSLSALTSRWSRVQSFVEKALEQALMQEATRLRSIDDLERKLGSITSDFMDLPVIKELSRDFGVQVIRFNIEARYPQETMDALNRKAEAVAGGNAYRAFAAAAELDTDSAECRELYKVYQETTGQVDAYRNLGGGITSLATVLSSREQSQGESEAADE